MTIVLNHIYKPTENQPKGWVSQVKTLLDSGYGTYKVQKTAGDTLALAVEGARLNGHTWSGVSSVSQVLKGAALGVTLPYTVSTVIDVSTTADALYKEGASTLSRASIISFCGKLTESISMICFSALMFVKSGILKMGGEVFDAIHDSTDVALSAMRISDLNDVSMKDASPEVKTAVSEERRLHCLKLAKAIFSVASAALGLVAFFFIVLKAPVVLLVPKIVTLALSVISGVLALTAHFYAKNMTYKSQEIFSAIELFRNPVGK